MSCIPGSYTADVPIENQFAKNNNKKRTTGNLIVSSWIYWFPGSKLLIYLFRICLEIKISQEISFLIDLLVLKARNIHIYNTWWLCWLFEDFLHRRLPGPYCTKILMTKSNRIPLLNFFRAVFLLRRLEGQQIDHQIYLKFQKNYLLRYKSLFRKEKKSNI